MFEKYSKIINSYKDDFLIKAMQEVPELEKWVVTEKLHGCNFSFLLGEDGVVKHCSRNQVLNMEDKFYNHRILQKYHEAIRAIKQFSGAKVIQVYGEYVGPNIQKGINYGDEDFYGFDIKLDGEYIPFYGVRLYLRKFGIKEVPVLYVGSLKECLEYPNEFDSKVLGEKDNICEGIVIKPMIPYYTKAGERIILKSKNDKWAEKAKMPKRPKEQMPSDVLEKIEELKTYVTPNRIAAVMSKDVELVGEYDHKKFGKLIKAVLADIYEDAEMLVIPGPVNKALSRVVANVAKKVVF